MENGELTYQFVGVPRASFFDLSAALRPSPVLFGWRVFRVANPDCAFKKKN